MNSYAVIAVESNQIPTLFYHARLLPSSVLAKVRFTWCYPTCDFLSRASKSSWIHSTHFTCRSRGLFIYFFPLPPTLQPKIASRIAEKYWDFYVCVTFIDFVLWRLHCLAFSRTAVLPLP